MADGLLEQREPGVARRLTARERRVESAIAALFALASAALLIAWSGAWRDQASALLLVATYAFVARVRFQVGPGLVRPTQLVLVPMLFLLPAPAVPALVALASVISELHEIARRRAHPERALVAVADSWHTIGPAIVVALLAEGGAEGIPWTVCVLALLSQFTVDFLASTLREWLGAWQAGRLKRSERRVGEAPAAAADRAALERLLLTTTIEAVQADCGRLSTRGDDGTSVARVILAQRGQGADALRAAEAALIAAAAPTQVMIGGLTALAIPLASQPSGRLERLTVGRFGRAFSPAERELLEHLAAQAAVSLENVRLQDLMRKTEAELRAILEGVADAVTAEDPSGRLVYVNAAAVALLGDGLREPSRDVTVGELVSRLEITDEHGRPVPAERLPGRRALDGENEPPPLVMRYRHGGTGDPRRSRVKAAPVLDERGRPRLAISVFEDITEIKQAEEVQRFLARSSNLLTDSLDIGETLPALARLAVPEIADWCTIHLADPRGLRCVATAHADPAKLALAEAFARDQPLGGGDRVGPASVARTGRSELYPDVTDELLATAAATPRHLHLLRSIAMVSAMSVPMRARDHVLGAITLISAESGRRFRLNDLALAEDLGLRAGAAVDNARLYRTRSAIAQTLQASLLPPVLPEIPGLETAALFRAAGEGHEVGGDFYDLFSTGPKQWFAVMGDVCGKGAEAAAVTALARYTIRAAVVRHRSPAGILLWLNDAMLRGCTGRAARRGSRPARTARARTRPRQPDRS